MGYIGANPNSGNLHGVDSFTGDGSTTGFTLTNNVTSNQSVLWVEGGVVQKAGTDYTASGTTLTRTTAPANGVACFAIYLGTSISIGTPADSTISGAKLATGMVNDLTSATITASDEILLGVNGTNVIRKDTVQGILDLVGGIETGAKGYKSSGNQTITTATRTVVELESTSYDLGSDFNTTTDRFVAPVTGEYIVVGNLRFTSTVDATTYQVELQVNGSLSSFCTYDVNGTDHIQGNVVDILQLSASDYVQLSVYHTFGSNKDISTGEGNTFLSVHRLS